MSGTRKQTNLKKVDIIDALLHMNLYKMPDGRQFYEATEKELESILTSINTLDNTYSI